MMRVWMGGFSRAERLWPAVVFMGCWLSAASAFAALGCGDLSNAYGPFDYTNPQHRLNNLPIVEGFHFKADVESLVGGSGVVGDLDYTLRAFPNHHRALHAFARYEIRERAKSRRNNQPYRPPTSASGFPATAECYFDRAIRWRPNDPTVRLVYGLYLHLTGRLEQALVEYKRSERIEPNSAELQYNMGLLYFDMQRYAPAKEHAKKAYQFGHPLPGLRNKLASVGQWP